MTAALLGIVGAYATLLPLGKWHPDEFIQIHDVAVGGWGALRVRVFGWSPRPLSELLLACYARLVLATGHPWLEPALVVQWLAAFAMLVIPLRRRRAHPLLLGSALFAAALLLAKPGEMFFWPAAAAPYLLGFALLGAVVVLQADKDARPALFGGALVAAAWCSESAALAVLFDVALLVVVGLLRPGGIRRAEIGPLVAGAAAAGFVVAVSLHHRAAGGLAALVAHSPTLGRPLASLRAAVPLFGGEIAATGPAGQSWPPTASLLLKAVLVLGFRPSRSEPAGQTADRWRALAAAASLLLAAFASVALGLLEFGENCCERHVTFRAALVVLALYAVGAAVPARGPGRLRVLVLAVPLFALFAARVPLIVADRGLIGPTLADRAVVWRSGRSAGPIMLWPDAPVPQLAEGAWGLPPGVYTLGPPGSPPLADWRDTAILLFFGKRTLVVSGG